MREGENIAGILEEADAKVGAGRPAEAEILLREALRAHPGDPAIARALARALAIQERHGEAAESLDRLRQAGAADSGVLADQGKLFRLAGRPEDAEPVLREALAGHPGHADAAYTLAFLLRDQGRWKEAGEVIDALASTLSESGALMQAAGFLWELGEYRRTVGILRRVVEATPRDARARLLLGRAREALGEFDQALTEFRRALDLRRDLPGAWLRLTLFRRVTDPSDPDLERLKGATEDRALSRESRACAGFALGKALDDMEDHGAAFQQFEAANRRWPHRGQWSGAAWDRQVDDTIRVFPSVKSPSPESGDQPRPVFIVGMLRSGTTLLERLLARHPAIAARGELNWIREIAGRLPAPGWPETWQSVPGEERDRLSRFYRDLGRRGEAGLRAFVDKNPLNFRYLGLIAELFPDAVLVHMRRDPRDIGLSLFQQAFEDPENAYAYELEDIVRFHRGYRRLMNHWEAVLGERLLDIRYEDLVEDPEGPVDEVLGRLGLERAVAEGQGAGQEGIRTASVWQARQPVHRRSVGRWRHYRDLAPDFFSALTPG